MSRRDLGVALAVTIFFVMGVSSVAPVLPHMRDALGLSGMQVALLAAVFALPGFLLAPLFGVVLDRAVRKGLLVPMLILQAAAGCLLVLARQYRLILFLRLLQGIGNAPLGTIAITLIADRSAGGERARALGLNSSALSLGTAVWPVAGGALALLGWNSPFLLSTLGLPLGVAALLILDSGAPPPERRTGSYVCEALTAVRQRPAAALYALVLGTFVLLYGPLLTLAPAYLADRFGATPPLIGLLISSMSVPAAIVAGATRPLVARWGSSALLTASFALYAASLALIPLVPAAALAAAPIGVFGVAQALSVPNLQLLLSEAAPPAQRGMFMALYGMLVHLAQTGAPLLTGLLVTVVPQRQAFAAACLLSLVLMAVAAAASSRMPRQTTEEPV